MEIVRLVRTSRLRSGHLWVFSNELAHSPAKVEPGSLVELRDKQDSFLGIGYINPHSLIAVRVLTREREEIGPDFFRRRIQACLEYRRRAGVERDSCRVVYSEGDLLPGLIVDRYDTCLSVQILTLGMEQWTETVVGILDELLSPETIVLRNDSPARLLEGLVQEKRVLKGELKRLPRLREDGVVLEVDPLGGQKTGFFLDQRENRIAFGRLLREGRGLDLFCYSGSWSIHMARNGAAVVGIDDSVEAIRLAERNAELNGVAGRCSFRKADVFAFLTGEASSGRTYDFIVLDPPAFVKAKTKVREALRGYREINANALRLVGKGGLLATSSCSHHIGREMFLDMLRSTARDAGKQVRVIEVRSQARDHPVLLSMPETEYLTCLFLEVC